MMIPFKKSAIRLAVCDALPRQQIMLNGFADAKPSESIQKDELPGLSVVALFPLKRQVYLLDVPGKQFKDCDTIKKKINNAERLTEWLHKQKEEGLHIAGFCLTQTQRLAAEFGLRLIEELPKVRVEKHYQAYRLYFSDSHIDFAQAVALEYYLFSAYFGMLRPSIFAKNIGASLTLFMDRFPGASRGALECGRPVPITDGMKFINYVREHSETYRAIEVDHKANNVSLSLTTLDWWSPIPRANLREGKTHPHFLLPDWLAAASLATEYRGEFIASHSPHKNAVQLADACKDLYQAFKEFQIWSLDDRTLQYITGCNPQWEVPEDARKFIIDRAER